MKNILLILLTSAFLFSCDESVDRILYNGDEALDRTFLIFPANNVNLPVAIDDTGSVDIVLQSSTISTSERSFSINLIAEETTANPLTYSLPTTVIIPANSYEGIISITGMDNGLVETDPETVVFSLGGLGDNVDMDTNKIIVNIFEFCPIQAPFSGNYLMEQLTAINPCDGVQVFEDQILEIAKTGETSRSFSAIYLEGISSGFPTINMSFSLICLEIIVDQSVSGLSCGTPPSIDLGPATTPSNYTADDDSMFELTLTEYYTSDGGCSCNPYEVTFRFTKQ